MSSFCFLYVPTGESWAVAEPVAWVLEHREDEILARAKERLLLSHDDPERVIRVVLRRCGLVLIHVTNEVQVVVHYWSQSPDLRNFFKAKGLARPEVQVVVWNRKTDSLVIHESGAIFLFGEPGAAGFPWGVYQTKWERRDFQEADDRLPADQSYSNFSWPGFRENFIPWSVLKSAWRNERFLCPNCDEPLFLLSFSWQRSPLSWRPGRVKRGCCRCRRSFADDLNDPLGWVANTLPPELRPTHLRWWWLLRIEWGGTEPRLV